MAFNGPANTRWIVPGGLLALAVATAASGQQPPALTVVSAATYSQPGRLVAVEGRRRLNLICMGTGSPVVVLEAGAADGAASWRKVQAEIATFTRACSYDRAGYGFSDPPDRSTDANNAADDLQKLLSRGGLREPIVLVGHSVGGLYAEDFAAQHPRQIAGMVLVDPTGLDDFRLTSDVITDKEREQLGRSNIQRFSRYARCLEHARQGEPVGPIGSECAPQPTGDTDLDNELRRQFGQPKYFETVQSEMKSFYPANYPDGSESIIIGQVRAHVLKLGQKPFILLASQGKVPPGERGERLKAAVMASRDKLVTASSGGKVVSVASGHYIQDEHPEVVIAAVKEAVFAVRETPLPRERWR